MKTININCDLGEGYSQEAVLMPYISSCNIACGGHFGDAQSIDAALQLACKNQLKVGAHPSFPDREHFGRKIMEISPAALFQSLQEQLSLFLKILSKNNMPLHHIKAHGALYNLVAVDKATAEVYLKAIKAYTQQGAALYVPYGSVIAQLAVQQGVAVIYEAFADRNYNEDLSLVSRSNPKAMISEPEKVLKHLLYMIQHEAVLCLSGKSVPIKAATYCLHGDEPVTLSILTKLHEEFAKHQLQVDRLSNHI
jgi:5-oxoprolinase (ATP-hydrolysing) subunit A|uniref:5-oxoprolinase subunit PxpA n=1 Tax=Polaribacter sp. TaxID=1920175 RepID=UPI00404753D1